MSLKSIITELYDPPAVVAEYFDFDCAKNDVVNMSWIFSVWICLCIQLYAVLRVSHNNQELFDWEFVPFDSDQMHKNVGVAYSADHRSMRLIYCNIQYAVAVQCSSTSVYRLANGKKKDFAMPLQDIPVSRKVVTGNQFIPRDGTADCI